MSAKETDRKPLLTWLHLSDLHFGHGSVTHGWDQRTVLRRLVEQTGEWCGDGTWPAVDWIAVTGDVAFSGGGKPGTGADEYPQAADWLGKLASTLDLGPEQVFVVPGNHDVNRGVERADRGIARLLRAVRAGDESLDEVLAVTSDRKMLLRRQAAFTSFAEKFGPAETHARPYWVYRATAASGLPYRVVGLNSALLAMNDEDRGKLAIGREQLVKCLDADPAGPDEVVIVLSHHPLFGRWLRDEEEVFLRLQRQAQVHLSGHLHQPKSRRIRAGTGGDLIQIVAGASHGEERAAAVPEKLGFNLASVRDDGQGRLSLEVRPVCWSRKSQSFVVDVENVPLNETVAPHSIALNAPFRTGAPSAPRRTQTNPRTTAASAIPDDRDAAAASEKAAPDYSIDTKKLSETEKEAMAGKVREAIRRKLVEILKEEPALYAFLNRRRQAESESGLAEQLVAADLNATLSGLVDGLGSLSTEARLAPAKGVQRLVTPLLSLAAEFTLLHRFRERYQGGQRYFLLKSFQQHYLAQWFAEILQQPYVSDINAGNSGVSPAAPNVVELVLETGLSAEAKRLKVEASLWKQVLLHEERYSPERHRRELLGYLGAKADHRHQIVILLADSAGADARDVAPLLPEVLWVHRCAEGAPVFKLGNEHRLGANLAALLALLPGPAEGA